MLFESESLSASKVDYKISTLACLKNHREGRYGGDRRKGCVHDCCSVGVFLGFEEG